MILKFLSIGSWCTDSQQWIALMLEAKAQIRAKLDVELNDWDIRVLFLLRITRGALTSLEACIKSLRFSLWHQLFKVYSDLLAQYQLLFLLVSNLKVSSLPWLVISLNYIIVLFGEVFGSIYVHASIDDFSVEKLHLQLNFLCNLKVLPMQPIYVLKVLIYPPVQCPLAHFLELLFVLMCQSIDKGAVGVQENGMLVIVIVQLLFKSPSPEEPKPARRVNKVSTFVHTILPHVIE